MKKFIFIFTVGIALFWGLFSFSNVKASETNQVRLYFFHTSTCPHCQAEEKFLNKIKESYPNLEIKSFLLDAKDNKKENQAVFKKVVEKFGLSGGVPVTLIGDEVIVGFNNEFGIGRKIVKRVQECSDQACPSFIEEGSALVSSGTSQNFVEKKSDNQNYKTTQVFGRTISLDGSKSLVFLGGLLGLADGINPCMFSVLMFLLVYLLGIGSSKKALKAGIAFVITTFLFYLLVMYGLIKIISVLQIEREIRIVVSTFAFFVGAVMIKDYFFYGKWFSFEISEKVKPTLERLTRKGTILSAIILAALSSLVELPCTSGIPLAYVSILSSREVFVLGYLVLYNLFFILPLVVIVLGTIFVWGKVETLEKWREKSKKYMRLTAGIILILLALAIWNNWL